MVLFCFVFLTPPYKYILMTSAGVYVFGGLRCVVLYLSLVKHPNRTQWDLSEDPVLSNPQPVRVCPQLCVPHWGGLGTLHVPL